MSCHKELDREIQVQNIIEVKNIGGRKETLFSKMVYAHQKEIKAGDKLQLKNHKPHVWGIIRHFVYDGDMNEVANKVCGTATLWYERHPVELYGSGKLQSEPVTAEILHGSDGRSVTLCLSASASLSLFVDQPALLMVDVWVFESLS